VTRAARRFGRVVERAARGDETEPAVNAKRKKMFAGKNALHRIVS
jgi:hypothetical protein